MEEYIEFLSFCDSPSLHDPGFLPWILSLPPLLRIIEEKAGFESLFQEYRQEALTRFACVDAAMEEITGVLKDNGLYQDVFLCFAPNLLQSPYLVDYALADNTLYIIGAVFSRTAVLHEYLHLLLHDRKAFFLQMAGEKELSHFADAALLRRLGYLPDDSLSSRAHALEDCFIRSLSGVLAGEKSAGDYVRTQKELGFVILPGTHGAAAQPAPGENEGWTRSSNSSNSSQPINRRKTRWETGSPTDKISLAFAGFPREGQFFMVLK